MKANIIKIVLVLILFPKLLFSQDMALDTALANNYFEIAVIFQDSTHYDSAILYFEKASILYQ